MSAPPTSTTPTSTTPTSATSEHVTVLKPPGGWQLIDFKELKEYRDLFYFLVWRDIKVLYAQTVLGFSWAILNPFVQIVIYSIIFGRVAKIGTDGIPFLLFNTCAVIPWTYMSETMTASSQSLVKEHSMLGKIYFPRLLFPLTPVLAKLVDFAISIALLASIMAYYHFWGGFEIPLTWNLALLPVVFLLMVCIPAGMGLWLSSLAIRFRDVKFAMTFFIRMLMYSAPVVYTATAIPDNYRFWYSFNPLVAVIEGYRACLLGTDLEWQFFLPGAFMGVLLLVSGALYFRRMERVIVDVI